MTALFGGAADRPVAHAAPSVLTGLMAFFGANGLAAAARDAGLLAAVDQHAAAVRDSLLGDVRPLTAAALAGYADGVVDAAVEHGWRLPEPPIDWSRPDWILVRILAVCALTAATPA
jgi:hypothetical protein